MTATSAERLALDGRTYELEVRRLPGLPAADISVAVISYNGRDLTRLAIDSVLRWAGDRCEIWAVDNASTDGSADDLLARNDCSVVLNRTPTGLHDLSTLERLLLRPGGRGTGSYSNGVGLEIAARYATSRWLFVMHNDSMVTHPAWLPFLLSKVGEQTRGVAMSIDPIRVNAMHCSGFLCDLDLVRREGLTFLPDLPRYDVGDEITIGIRRLGLDYYVCPNTFNRPGTVEWIPAGHPLRDVYCSRTFDDERNVIYAHLGRGTAKAAGQYSRPGKTDAATWLEVGRRLLA
jgi:glycosyltransferase involved in cell wall biosynthesis